MQIVVLLVLILLNGLFSMAEISVVSARKVRLQQWINEGHPRAKAALALAESPMNFLSATQIGITLVGILAGAYGEAALAERLAAWLGQFPAIAPYHRALSLSLVVLAVTYLSLVLGELVPKRLGLHQPERIACLVAGPMRWLAVVAAPAVRLLAGSTDLVLRLVGVGATGDSPVTEEEIKVLIEQAADAGVFTTAEEDLLQSAVRLADREVESLMTPRTEVVWLDLDEPEALLKQTIIDSRHSRFPLARGSLDDLLGIVLSREILAQSLAGEPFDLAALRRDPLVVPEGGRVERLLEQFRSERTHLAVVVDEYGGVAGLITIEDVLDALLGDLPLHDEPVEERSVRRPDGTWLIDGLLPVEDFKRQFDLDELPDEDDYVTLAGFVIYRLGRLPQLADVAEYEGFRFEVVDMDGRRIDKVLVTPPPAGEGDRAG